MLRIVIFLGTLFWCLAAAGGVIVLKNGRKVQCHGPYEIKGDFVHYKDANGNLFQLPLKLVDLEKSTTKDPVLVKKESPAEKRARELAEKRRQEEEALYRAVRSDSFRETIDTGGPDAPPSGGQGLTEQMASSFECRQFLGYVRMANVPNLKRMLSENIPFEGPAYDRGNLEQPILVAAYNASLEITDILLRAGANPNQLDRNGKTALMVALQRGTPEHMNVAKRLIEQGADPNIRSKAFVTALDIALAKKSAEMIRLLGKDVNLDQMDKNGYLPIFKAIENRDAATVDALLANNLDRTIKSRSGFTIFQEATRQGGKEVVEVLLKHGFSPEEKDAKGRTAIDLAILVADFDLAGFLIEKKPPEFKKTLEPGLVRYVRDGAEEQVSFLLGVGVSPDTQMPGDDPILIQAARNGNLEMVRMLVDYGADVSIKGVAGLTADKLAAGLKKSEISQFIQDRQSRSKK